MKLGTETGSVINHLHSRATIGAPEPEVGMGATILGWTDRHAATVVAWDGKIVTIQQDKAILVGGRAMSEDQEYRYEPNPSAHIRHFRRDKSGNWSEVVRNDLTHRWNKVGGAGIIVGFRNEYRDPHF